LKCCISYFICKPGEHVVKKHAQQTLQDKDCVVFFHIPVADIIKRAFEQHNVYTRENFKGI